MYDDLAILAIFTLVYSIIAARVERTSISGPILFVVFGFFVGPGCLKLLSLKPNAELLSALAELTLALVLFTDAAGTDLSVLRRAERLPIRLLAIGLPLTLFLGFGVGAAIFPELSMLEMALLATMLAPTDAALGRPVVTNASVPSAMRQGLNVESGLNDGICVPILLLFLMSSQGQVATDVSWWMALDLFARAVGIGLLTGATLAALTVVLLRFAMQREWLSPTWIKVLVVALAFACFGTSQALGGSGFIASFIGGMLFGGLFKPNHERVLNAAEGLGETFALLTWVLFGAAVVGEMIGRFSWQVLAYAVLSLTVIRMLPVFVALTGLSVSNEGKFFIGWFGPRGLASIVFAVMVLRAKLPHSETLTTAVVYTILLSILLHGMTANPWARAFGDRAAGSA